MEFTGFANRDFDFFKKKNSTNKEENDVKKEEVKRHFREYCYEIQKNYHSNSGGTILLEKDFQGLNKNKNYISAFTKVAGIDCVDLNIDLGQNDISIGLLSISNDDLVKFKMLSNLIMEKDFILQKFFKENKEMHAVLHTKGYKKATEGIWIDDIKFDNNELSIGGLAGLMDNMKRLESANSKKKAPAVFIGMRYLKSDAIKMGKALAAKSCGEVVKLLSLCEMLK